MAIVAPWSAVSARSRSANATSGWNAPACVPAAIAGSSTSAPSRPLVWTSAWPAYSRRDAARVGTTSSGTARMISSTSSTTASASAKARTDGTYPWNRSRRVASRDATRRERFQGYVPSVRAFAEAEAVVDDVELIILAVPDDVVPTLAASLRLYAGQALVHTSGLLGADVLLPAMAAGTQAGAFHPLVAFADLDRALAALRGATIAIEGDDELVAHLAEMAEAIGGVPVRLPPGSKAAYHAAAVLAAGGVDALLDTIREVAAVMGLDEAGALRIYLPLLEQTVANARALGIAAALTGPTTRGDAGTVAAHVAALEAGAPAALPVY